MEQSRALAEIEAFIGEGDTEKALELLLSLLGSKPEWAELNQTVRIIQADYFQIKSQALRGTITADNERTAYNQIRDKLLGVANSLKADKPTPDAAPVAPKQAWRYYAAGGVVALAVVFLLMNVLNGKKEACPSFGRQISQRVMILPFKKTDSSNQTEQEILLSTAFNELVLKDNKQFAEADVNQAYDINKNYPNPSEAAAIGRECGVEIVVWGTTGASKDVIEVRYRVVKPAALAMYRDTSRIPDYINSIKDLGMEGVLKGDVQSVARMLYMVAIMQEGSNDMALQALNNLQPIAMNESMAPGGLPKSAAAMAAIDTTALLLNAEALLQIPSKQDSALQLFNQVLAAYPENYRALRGRGLYFLKENDYTAAVHDLHIAQPDPAKVDPTTLRIRTDAYLKGGWPEMARRDLEQIKKDTTAKTNKAWIKDREKKITDSIHVYEVRLEQAKSAAVQTPGKNVDAKIRIAKANIALGKPDEAVKYSESVNLTNPKNTRAIEVTLEAYTQKADLQKAQETIDKAERRGVDTKSVKYRPSAVQPLETDKKN
jgi:tetratricopeptide (TPR) repeat protein